MAHPKSSLRSKLAKMPKRKIALREEVKVVPGAGPKRKTAPKSETASSATAKIRAPKLLPSKVYHASPLERIEMIRRGIPAAEAKRLVVELPIGQGVAFNALNLSTATVNKKAKQGDTLSRDESERIVGFAKLLGQLEAMILESGDPKDFDSGAWMARWLTEPLPAFGGARPADLMDTMEGQGLVSSALAKLQSGAYS
jgi:putative toxin-antitoxin system antitoxin component (TIGR02293 family)